MQQNSPIKVIHDLARRNKISIEYQVEKESGPAHAKEHTVRLRVGEKSYIGTERTIKFAQRAAAQLALDDHRDLLNADTDDQFTSEFNEKKQLSATEKVKTVVQKTLGPPSSNVCQSPIAALNTWSHQNHLSSQYVLLTEQFKSTSKKQSRVLFNYRLYLGHDLYFDGHGYTHQQARTNCALRALHFLQQTQPSSPHSNALSSSTFQPQKETKSDISLMYERAKQLGLPVRVTSDDPFTVSYHVGESYSSTGKGHNKQSAKQSAAKKMLEMLPMNDAKRKLNPVTRVYQLAQLRQVKVQFIETSNEENFVFQIKFGNHETAEGSGKTKQAAKQSAAESLLEKVAPAVVLPPPPTKGLLKRAGNNPSVNKQEKHVHFVEGIIEKDEATASRSTSTAISSPYKYKLIEACQKLRIQIEYLDSMDQDEQTGSSRYQTIVNLSNGGRLLAQFRGQGPSLIRAQENASSAVWSNLKQLFNGSVRAQKARRYEKNYRPVPIQH